MGNHENEVEDGLRAQDRDSLPPGEQGGHRPTSRENASSVATGLFRRPRVGVRFNVVPLLLYNATQLALHRLERVMNDFLKGFVSAVIHVPFIGHKLVTRRHGHVDAAPVWIPLVMIMIGLFDGDIAAVDMIAKFLKSC